DQALEELERWQEGRRVGRQATVDDDARSALDTVTFGLLDGLSRQIAIDTIVDAPIEGTAVEAGVCGERRQATRIERTGFHGRVVVRPEAALCVRARRG